MKFNLLVLAVIAMFVGGAVALRHGHRHPAPSVDDAPAVEAEAAPAPAPAPPPPAPVPAQPPRRPTPPAGPTEAALMATLRDLGASDPARALELAREGERRFPNSADAAERGWTICKSLAALGRSAEAQDEARRMVQDYPGTTWAGDVRRHLLTQPLTDPGQRGYGKASELD